MRAFGFALTFLSCLCWASAADARQSPPAPDVTLQASESTARAGYFRLEWSGPPQAPGFVLQRAPDAAFDAPRELYRGSDRARVESGLADGTYHYRVRVDEQAAPWSAPVAVTVEHHPLPRALGFLAVGLLVFLATFTLIVRGARAAAKECS